MISQNTVAYGTMIPKPANPTKASDETYDYAFKEWRNYQESMTMPDYDLNFIAEFNAVKKATTDGCSGCAMSAGIYLTNFIAMLSLLMFVLRKKH